MIIHVFDEKNNPIYCVWAFSPYKIYESDKKAFRSLDNLTILARVLFQIYKIC